MIGDYHGGSSNEDGEKGLRLRIPRLTLSQREKRDEKKEYQEIYVGLIMMRWIQLGKEIKGGGVPTGYYFRC